MCHLGELPPIGKGDHDLIEDFLYHVWIMDERGSRWSYLGFDVSDGGGKLGDVILKLGDLLA